ncbi:MAG: cytochrome c [Betaproteobacteria bacterium]|nr:cytochrome c [Betaproteobacteria bacterium]
MMARTLVVLLAGIALAGPLHAGDAAEGKKKTQMCEGCHGIDGYRTAYPKVYSAPRLGGQHAEYLIKALQAYKSGERKHPSMVGVAGSLTDADMANLAAYYAAQ